MPGRRLLRLPVLAVALAAAVLAGGCNKETEQTSAKNTSPGGEGTYLTVDGLKYQVQLSRELNPVLGEDRAYLQGLPPGTPAPTAGQEWFAIWIRVENSTSRARPDSPGFEITDASGRTIKPLKLSKANAQAYQPGIVPAKSIVPQQNTIAYRSPTQGALVLFKLDYSVYQNRPANLHILAPDGSGRTAASLQLDL
jgi:hypothetical protein